MDRRAFLALSGLAALRPFASVGLSSPEQVGPDTRLAEIAALVTEKMTEYRVPGVALGIAVGGSATLRTFGVTNVDDPQPLTPDTLMTIASISKTMTATAIVKLVEQGKVDLKAPVKTYLPDFAVQDPAATRDVAVWHLLTHTPGWEGQLSTEDRGVDALSHFVATIMRDLPQLAPPGAVWSYNNAGFALAGRLIEVVTNRTIHDALRDLVFAPLGLTNTFTRLPDVMARRFTLGHREQNGRTLVIRPYQTTSSTTAGGVMTSLTDLMRYAQFHLGDGTGAEGKPFLTRALLADMRTPRLKKNSTLDDMGIGWHLRPVGGTATAAHGGTLNGHCLHVQLVPARNLAFVILTNHTDGWRLVQDVEHAILRLYAQVALTPNQPIGHRGVNEAMTFHSKALATQPPLAQYAGTYRRPPVGTVEVRDDNGTLVAGNARLVFYGPDVAYATSGGYVGTPYEFVRAADGRVGWIRVNGRIARLD